MLRTLAQKLEKLGQITDMDADKATIRCLAHVIHLAVMALLVELGAVTKEDAESVPLVVEEMSPEEAEEEEGDLDEADMDDDELASLNDPNVDLSSLISKAS